MGNSKFKYYIKKILRFFPHFRLIDNHYNLSQQIGKENQEILNALKEVQIKFRDIEYRLEEEIKSIKETLVDTNTYTKNEFNNLTNNINLTQQSIKKEVILLKDKIESIDWKIDNLYNNSVNHIETSNIIQQHIKEIAQDRWKICDIQEQTKQLSAINIELIPYKTNNLLNKHTNKKNILIMGFYGAPNIGDELMLEVLIQKLRKYNNVTITVMVCDNPYYHSEKWDGISIIHLPKTRYDFALLVDSFDHIIWGGGAMLDDSLNLNSDAYKSHIPVILREISYKAIKNQKKVFLLGVSSNKYIEDEKYIRDLTYIVDNANYVAVRDKYSKDVLVNLGMNEEKIEVIHDIVFSLEYRSEAITDKNILGIVLIADDNIDKIKYVIKEAIYFITERTNEKWEIHFIPFYTYVNRDINYLNDIVKDVDFKGINYKVFDEINETNMLIDTFKMCKLMICMRYHASLLCLKYGIPVINIIYDIHLHYENKLRCLADLYSKYNFFISYSNIQEYQIKKQLEDLYKDREEINNYLIDISKTIEEEANVQLDEIIKRIE